MGESRIINRFLPEVSLRITGGYILPKTFGFIFDNDSYKKCIFRILARNLYYYFP